MIRGNYIDKTFKRLQEGLEKGLSPWLWQNIDEGG